MSVIVVSRYSAISIHAPRAGRDKLYFYYLYVLEKFQSTRPVRGATVCLKVW